MYPRSVIQIILSLFSVTTAPQYSALDSNFIHTKTSTTYTEFQRLVFDKRNQLYATFDMLMILQRSWEQKEICVTWKYFNRVSSK